jgi:UDPglucose 6-dehydrogenase
LYIGANLLEEKAKLVITDPRALDNAKIDLKGMNIDTSIVDFIEDPYQAVSGCDAIALLTEWDLYKELDYEYIFHSMSKPAFIFDGRNILDHDRLYQTGFNVFPIGKTPLVHF